jgi:hypothetical protein
MGWICQHCGAPFVDSAYRVKSEESGVVLLDIIVCEHCHVEARDLGLHTEKILVRNSSPARNRSSSRKKTGFAGVNRKATGVIDQWLTLGELSKLFGLSEESIKRLAKKNGFPLRRLTPYATPALAHSSMIVE